MRPLEERDAEAVAALFVESYGESRPVDPEEIRSWFRNEALDNELLQVLLDGGDVVGYGDLAVQGDEVALDVAAPGRWDVFLNWAEGHARLQRLARVRVFVPAGHALQDAVADRGYHVWRSSFTMETALDDPPPPKLPDGFEPTAFRKGRDEETLRTALNECFADDPFFHRVSPLDFREFYLRARGFDPGLWVLAWEGDELAGLVLAYTQSGADTDVGWVGSLGVRPRWRRRGLGEALLRAAFHGLYARGLRRAGLGVDTENPTGALRLYERAGMHAVQRFDNWVVEV